MTGDRETGGMDIEDPVCGKAVDIDRAAARREKDGWLYFFCSAACAETFDRAPQRYVFPSAPRRTKGAPDAAVKNRC